MEKEVENVTESPPQSDTPKVEESPKPLAFTIDFGDGKTVDTQRHKALVEKYQNRHRRGQSLSKIEDPSLQKKSGASGRKSSIQSEGYYSSDERGEKSKSTRVSPKMSRPRGELTLPLKNMLNEKMSQSFPSAKFNLSTIKSPDIELKDISPELDPASPYSPKTRTMQKQLSSPSPIVERVKVARQFSSPECKKDEFINMSDFDFDKSDSVSDAGTYTIDNDNYTEEQKARMSIDKEFNIEQMSVAKKTEEYVRSLSERGSQQIDVKPVVTKTTNLNERRPQQLEVDSIISPVQNLPSSSPISSPPPLASNQSYKTFVYKDCNLNKEAKPKLSPILSPTQNMSITETKGDAIVKEEDDMHNKTFTKIIFPSPKSKTGISVSKTTDQGCFTSVTSSGAFSRKLEGQKREHYRQPSLSKSEIHVETYTASTRGQVGDNVFHATISVNRHESGDKNVPNKEYDDYSLVNASLTLGKVNNLPSSVGGKLSPTKIPSPVHSARPRSRNNTVDLSDSSLETESYLKPTQNIINSLQKKLSLDSDPESSDFDSRCNYRLNNEAPNLMKQKSSHIRHNSFDDRNLTISNKLEHFQNKNLQSIDQTFTNKLIQPPQNRVVQKVQNSPNSSPLRRSSSFSSKNKPTAQPKVSNLSKDVNLKNSPSFARSGSSSIQRSASTANIRPNIVQLRRSSADKIDRSQFGDTESSSEEDFERNLAKKKDLTNLTSTRYNRAFSLRRARLDTEQPTSPAPKCPNTPEMRRKFQQGSEHLRSERAFSVDRRPVKTNEVQSRYLQNISRVKSATPPTKAESAKNVPKYHQAAANKPQVFSRTDSGRFSMRTTKSPVTSSQKNLRKDSASKKQPSGRSNSSLSSREVEFQNWKRRKSYDPMKAAAEGKRKAELAKKQAQNLMVQSYSESNQDCDSSPSHSSSVHRSQSFHGTAALEQLISSEEEDLTLSADEGFSPPMPSPCELSPARVRLRDAWKDKVLR